MSEAVEIIRRHVKHADVILDIGCANIDPLQHVGDQNEFQELSAVWPNAIFYLFEPDPRWRDSILRIIEVRRNVVFNRSAVGAKDGEVDFHQSVDWKWSSSIREPKEHLKVSPCVQFAPPIKVPCRSLDSWSNEIWTPRIDLIWADIQGAEVDMINGGQQCLARTRFLYTEYDDVELYAGQINLAKILELLPAFEVVDRWHNNVLLRNTKI